MGALLILGIIVVVLVVGFAAWRWVYWGTWTQPNTYTGVISSFTHYTGFLFGQTHYKVEFYGGSNITWHSKEFTLVGGFVPQPVNISSYNLRAGMNCTFVFKGNFLQNVSCGSATSKPAWG